jgi:hypothetical protein
MSKYIVNGKSFPTKKSLTDYFMHKKDKFHNGTLLKHTDIDFFNDFINLLEYHCEAQLKLDNLKDVMIKYNESNNYAFYIVKNNDEIIDVSYRHCINCIGREKKEMDQAIIDSNLNQAMRNAINPQILDYIKENNIHDAHCKFCGLTNNLQVDHIIQFSKLKSDFIKLTGRTVPTLFDRDREHNYKRIFKDKDNNFKQEWISYHNKNATLRYLCKKCNLSRNKK